MQLGYLAIKAPIAGRSCAGSSTPGNMASPGQPLLEIEQVGTMKVMAAGRRAGREPRRGRRHRHRRGDLAARRRLSAVPVARIVPAANAAAAPSTSRRYLPNPDGRLKSGMFARVLRAGGRARGRPGAGGGPRRARPAHRRVAAWTPRAARRLRWIRLGRAQGDEVEVLSGLAGGETVVLTAEQPLDEGDRVVK